MSSYHSLCPNWNSISAPPFFKIELWSFSYKEKYIRISNTRVTCDPFSALTQRFSLFNSLKTKIVYNLICSFQVDKVKWGQLVWDESNSSLRCGTETSRFLSSFLFYFHSYISFLGSHFYSYIKKDFECNWSIWILSLGHGHHNCAFSSDYNGIFMSLLPVGTSFCCGVWTEGLMDILPQSFCFIQT